MTPSGLVIAAPSSGSGKTTVTLGLLRALSRSQPVRAAKSGPDYIDVRFHQAACGQPCVNLDAWAMDEERLQMLASGPGLLMIEGAMGLFDGAPPLGRGATADLARVLDLPIVLVVDASHMAQSIAPLVMGFTRHDPDLTISAVILNKVGSPRHERMLRTALANAGAPPVIGAITRSAVLAHPSRHLGLVQADERPDLDAWLDEAADIIAAHVDLSALVPRPLPGQPAKPRITPPGQKIAVARDQAFGFSYEHMLSDWKMAGAEVRFFSPLADEPVPQADFIFLPGGYPELHAGRLASNTRFLDSIRKAAETTMIYGECGGYMVLGDALTDADGVTHQMLGLLQLETSFAKRKLHLGYRNLRAEAGPFTGQWAGHEFHYATTLRADGPTLFEATDAEANTLAPMGLRQGLVCGSFAHLIDRVDLGLSNPQLRT